MANVLTNLIPNVYVALDVVSRELTGLIPAVSLDASASQAAVNQSVYAYVAPAATSTDTTPAATSPDTGDQTIGNVEVKITKSKHVPFRWSGEDTRGLAQAGGFGVLTIQQNQIAQAMRTLVNEVEADLAALHTTFSRAYGTAGTTPFGTAGDFTDATNAMKILKDNGAPGSDNHLVLNTTAGATYLGKQSRFDIQGSNSMLLQGVIGQQAGMMVRESGQILTNTAGTAASATTNNAGYAVGATVLTLASAGTGTLVAGDVVTFAGDTNKYVIASGDADVSNGGTITLAEPGLRVAMSAATKAITVVAAAARNMCFNRSAIVLAARAPALPEGGDMADMVEYITDPRTGLTFELAVYKQFRQNRYQLGLAWGTKNVAPRHTALLLG